METPFNCQSPCHSFPLEHSPFHVHLIEAMVMLLSRMPDLKLLYLQFQSPRSIPDQEVQSWHLPPPMHIVFPALVSFLVSRWQWVPWSPSTQSLWILIFWRATSLRRNTKLYKLCTNIQGTQSKVSVFMLVGPVHSPTSRTWIPLIVLHTTRSQTGNFQRWHRSVLACPCLSSSLGTSWNSREKISRITLARWRGGHTMAWMFSHVYAEDLYLDKDLAWHVVHTLWVHQGKCHVTLPTI